MNEVEIQIPAQPRKQIQNRNQNLSRIQVPNQMTFDWINNPMEQKTSSIQVEVLKKSRSQIGTDQIEMNQIEIQTRQIHNRNQNLSRIQGPNRTTLGWIKNPIQQKTRSNEIQISESESDWDEYN